MLISYKSPKNVTNYKLVHVGRGPKGLSPHLCRIDPTFVYPALPPVA